MKRYHWTPPEMPKTSSLEVFECLGYILSGAFQCFYMFTATSGRLPMYKGTVFNGTWNKITRPLNEKDFHI